MADTSTVGTTDTDKTGTGTGTCTGTGTDTSEMTATGKLASAATNNIAITIDSSRAASLHSALSSVLARIQTASAQRQGLPSSSTSSRRAPPRLVAVSKLKPASDILALHQPLQTSTTTTATTATTATTTTAQIHFGENYAQELIEKSRVLPRSIKWHMIGGLQSNKCRDLARQVSNLWAVESVDSVKKAGLLEKGRAERVLPPPPSPEGEGGDKNEHENEKLRIFVQVNTSGEASKAGVAPDGEELVQLCRYVREQCPHLQLQGLMTIGAIARSHAAGEGAGNEDFECLKQARERVVRELGLQPEELELSMGMSEDFEAAIVQGSDEVRVGTTIFGTRPPKSEAKVI